MTVVFKTSGKYIMLNQNYTCGGGGDTIYGGIARSAADGCAC